MKKIALLALSTSLIALSCNDKTEQVTTTTEQTVAVQTGAVYNVDTQASTVKWTGYHKGGLNPRYGIMTVTGTLTADQENLTSGELISDVSGLTTDPAAVSASEGKKSTDLDEHLKSPDFFDIEKYPTVKFAITKIENLAAGADTSKIPDANKIVSGNLTIKDKTVNVSFPAKVEISETQVSVASKFRINRTDWGLVYGAEGNPQDWAISPDVDLELNIVAKK